MFIDRINIYVKAGNGGNGAVSFRREKYVSHGGPDGGDGGRGGDIIFKIDPGANTLLAFRYKRKFVAGVGGNGAGSKFHGKNGDAVTILVPAGTVIRDAKNGRILKDMSGCDEWICCKGGRGGWGNRHFATPTRQIPRFAKSGAKGEEYDLALELKMLADVGLVGLPSAGKSSLLAACTSARPKIAEYHFTTLSPNLGVVVTGEERAFVMADIPGLIEGAADGAGLGHEFLRHIERCRLLIQVVDVSCVEGGAPADDLRVIDEELRRFSPELAGRPRIVAANKVDSITDDRAKVDEFEAAVEQHGWQLYYICAVTGEGVPELIDAVDEALRLLPPMTVYEPEVTPEELALPEDSHAVEITRGPDGVYEVEAEWLYNLVGQVNFEDYESLSFFDRVLRKAGVIDALREAGCTDGSEVRIYDFEFDFVN